MHRSFLVLMFLAMTLAHAPAAFGQVYGIELHNSMMPASAGMAGTSFSRPQDIQSAINGNPATVIQFSGTQFSFGAGVADATYNVTQSAPLPLVGVTPYSAESNELPGILTNIGLTQEMNVGGLPVVVGLGFLTNAGSAVDFRNVPASNGTHASYLSLDAVNSVAVQLNDYLSVGGNVALATSILDGPFVASSSAQTDYALRYSVGANLELLEGISLGGFWQSKKEHVFEDVARFGPGPFLDLALDHPSNIGVGIANRNLLNGRLLLAADALFKQYSDANFYRAIYNDQWVFQFGGQLAVGPRTRLRIGYAFNEDPTRDTVPGTIGGVIPVGGIPAVQYVQAQFASISEHRLTCGIGISEVIPNADLDLSAGGMFRNSRSFGSTTASVESYWVALGMTWRFGANNSLNPRRDSSPMVVDDSQMMVMPQ